jgi:hypothetical protein
VAEFKESKVLERSGFAVLINLIFLGFNCVFSLKKLSLLYFVTDFKPSFIIDLRFISLKIFLAIGTNEKM